MVSHWSGHMGIQGYEQIDKLMGPTPFSIVRRNVSRGVLNQMEERERKKMRACEFETKL